MMRAIKYSICFILIILISCGKEKEQECVSIRDPMEQMQGFTVRNGNYDNLIANGQIKKTDIIVSQDCDMGRARVDTFSKSEDRVEFNFHLAARCNPVYVKWDNADIDTLSFTYETGKVGPCTSIGNIRYYLNGEELRKDTIIEHAYTIIK